MEIWIYANTIVACIFLLRNSILLNKLQKVVTEAGVIAMHGKPRVEANNMKCLKLIVFSLAVLSSILCVRAETNATRQVFTNGILQEYRAKVPDDTRSDVHLMYLLIDANTRDGRYDYNPSFVQESRALMGEPLYKYFHETNYVYRNMLAETQAKARDGDPAAERRIGAFLAAGMFGAETNLIEATKWYRRAADKGFAEAQTDLALCYSGGEGVQKDEAQALEWLRKAAAQNYAFGQTLLALAYANGQGVLKNFEEAVKWSRKAADQGFFLAQEFLGKRYYFGQGVPQDFAEAARWFRKAAEQGLESAQCNLAGCYHRGEGVVKDYVQAYKWYNLSSAQGNTEARKALSALEQAMTAEQIAEAQRDSQRELKNKEMRVLKEECSPRGFEGTTNENQGRRKN